MICNGLSDLDNFNFETRSGFKALIEKINVILYHYTYMHKTNHTWEY